MLGKSSTVEALKYEKSRAAAVAWCRFLNRSFPELPEYCKPHSHGFAWISQRTILMLYRNDLQKEDGYGSRLRTPASNVA